MHSNGKVVWSDVPSAIQSLTEDKVISLVDYLINNIYVSVGNRIYRQCPYGHRLCTTAGQSIPVLLWVQIHEKLSREQ